MDIMELGAVGELVGGVAVIGSLLYVGAQVRQGNRLAREQAHEEITRLASDFTTQMAAEDIELMLRGARDLGAAPLLCPRTRRGARDLGALTDVERALLIMRLTSILNYYERLFYARERGDADDDMWESRVTRMRVMFNLFAPIWPTHKVAFGRRFRAFVDNEVLPHLNTDNPILPSGADVSEPA